MKSEREDVTGNFQARNSQDPAPGHRAGSWVPAAETLALALLVPLLGHWLNPIDPFFVAGPISWALFGPLLAGLRHGVLAGFGCAAALALGMMAAWKQHFFPVPFFPGQLIVALLLAGMIAGEFAHVWTTRLRHITAVNGYQRQRFDEFARNYHLLKVSHDALDEHQAAGALSLRNALVALRSDLLAAVGEEDRLRGCSRLVLDLFAAHGRVRVAALFSVSRDRLVEPAVATLGGFTADLDEEPLIREALRTHQVASLGGETSWVRGADGADEGGGSAAGGLVAAVPFVDVGGSVWGLLAVQDMPFHAFVPENLRLLALMGGSVADTLSFGSGGVGGASGQVDAFERMARRCLVDARRHKVPARLVAFQVPVPGLEELLPQLLEERRGLDQAILFPLGDRLARLLVLLPLTDDKGASGYVRRLDLWLQVTRGLSLREAGVELLGIHGIAHLETERLLEEMRSWAAIHEKENSPHDRAHA